jgi:hypothetical protein
MVVRSGCPGIAPWIAPWIAAGIDAFPGHAIPRGHGVKATLREFGGPIDPTGQRARIVDTGSMNQETADELARLVAEAKTQPPGPDATAGKGRDMMSYSITIEQDGRSLVLKQSDATRTQAFIDLQNWIKQNATRP